MDFFEAIKSRRSIRKFTGEPVSDVQLAQILEAGRIAPSGSNSQPWKFLVITNPERKAELQAAAANQPFVGAAGAVVAVLGDRKAFRRRLKTGRQLAEIGAVDVELMAAAASLYKKRSESPDYADRAIVANCMIAAEHMALAATALGLGSCWVMLMDFEKVAEILSLPGHLFPVALLPLGHPAQEPGPRPRYPLGEIAFRDGLDSPWEQG